MEFQGKSLPRNKKNQILESITVPNLIIEMEAGLVK